MARFTIESLTPQVETCIAFLRDSGALSSFESTDLQTTPAYLRSVARILKQKKYLDLEGWRLSLRLIRTISGDISPAVLVIDTRIKVKPNLRAFVGHRFTDRIKRSLRHNLQTILQPYGIRASYPDWEMKTGQILDLILQNIKSADFCIFDDRETETRPNVLIELGFAIALGRPYLFFSHKHKRPVLIDGKEERIDVAADLRGLLYESYDDYEFRLLDGYEDMVPTLARKLPTFLVSHGLAVRDA